MPACAALCRPVAADWIPYTPECLATCGSLWQPVALDWNPFKTFTGRKARQAGQAGRAGARRFDILWQPVAACAALWHPVPPDWIPYRNLYSILAGWRPVKLDDLKVAGILVDFHGFIDFHRFSMIFLFI